MKNRISHTNVTKACLLAIRSAIKHFESVEKEINQYIDNDESLIDVIKVNQPCINKVDINKINYIALIVLEKLEIVEPNQYEIDIVETLILLAIQFEHLTPEKFGLCVERPHVARRFLLREFRKNSHSL